MVEVSMRGRQLLLPFVDEKTLGSASAGAPLASILGEIKKEMPRVSLRESNDCKRAVTSNAEADFREFHPPPLWNGVRSFRAAPPTRRPRPYTSGSQEERSVGSGTKNMVARRSRAAAAPAAEAEAPPVVAGPSDGEEDAGSDGGDEAPEEVTFESARVAAEEARRLAGERARREKAILKEKRRRREELFKEQKKRKLLPENVLEELASTTQESRNQQCDAPENAQDIEDDSETEDEDTKEDSEEETTTAKLQENYMAVRLKDQDTINRQQQEARNFVQKLLYGEGSNRTTANQYFSTENKKRAVKKAAVQFVSNSWGKTKKQKAKRFTKHWVSKITP